MIELKRRLGLPLNEVEIVAWRERRARSRLYAYLGPDAALTQLYDGQFIVVDPKDEQISVQIIARGYWEPWVETAVLRMLRKGDRVIEVGANVGYYTLLMARRVGPAGHLYSFEANPHLAALLRRSIALNHHQERIDLFDRAASDRPGTVVFRTSRAHSGGGHIRAGAAAPPKDVYDVEVEGVRLDEVLPFGAFQLMRLDAEGSEALILQGALAILRRSPDLRICMEWDRLQLSARTDIPAMIDILTGEGFRFWKIEVDASLTSIDRSQLLALPHSDIVACRAQPF